MFEGGQTHLKYIVILYISGKNVYFNEVLELAFFIIRCGEEAKIKISNGQFDKIGLLTHANQKTYIMKNQLILILAILGCSAFKSDAQCPDNMYFLGLGGASYFFYNNPQNPDICTLNPPATIQILDLTAFCGPADFTSSAGCIPIAQSPPPITGMGYVQNDPICTDPQIIVPLEVTWGNYTCTYTGTAGSPYTLQSSSLNCASSLNITNIPISDGIYQADIDLTSTGLVNSTGDVEFKAGDFICLNGNFEVKAGADFDAIIEGCQ